MFEPDTLIPEQFFASLRERQYKQGEKRLLLAILEDAVHHFQAYLFSGKRRDKRLFKEAEDWLMSQENEWVFSCVNICNILDINPGYLQNGLKAWKEKQVRTVNEGRAV